MNEGKRIPLMNDTGLARLVKESEVVQMAQDLVRTQSVNPPGNELAAAKYVVEVLKKCDVAAELVMHSETRASALARLKGQRRGPALFYNGHLDTVPVGAEKWVHEPFGGEVAEGRIWGRGAADMKGGLAAMMTAIKVLAEARVPLKGDLILAATAGEEIDSLGATAVAKMLSQEPIQGLFIAEPTYNEIYLAEKGVFWVQIDTFGKTAHGSMPEKGRNAVLMMVKLINEFEKVDIPYKHHPILGGFSRSLNTISGGVKTNVVPDHCVTTIDMRTVPGQEHSAILRRIENIIKDLSRRVPDFKATVQVVNDHASVETSPSDPIVQTFSAIVTEMTGQKGVFKGANYFSDAVGFLPIVKAPLILFGPGEPGQAHQPNEHVEVAKLVESAEIFTVAAARLLG
jgi:succinyl-diaminopimelate desuccinylase